MYMLPILLALSFLVLMSAAICVGDAWEKRAQFMGRSDQEQLARMLKQHYKLQDARAYVSYRFKR
jgi:hypothetical protein